MFINSSRYLLLLVALSLIGCQSKPTGGFAIYLLAEDIPSAELSNANLQDLPCAEQPILSESDLVSYDPDDHEMELTDSAYRRIQQIFPTPVRVSGIPFVVCVGDEPIYAGAFWTPLSSLSFDGVVIMQPFVEGDHRLRIELGYPGSDFFIGKDPRPDLRIMKALEASGKLK
jgi:hypothetical protein